MGAREVEIDSTWSWLVSVGAFVATLLEIGMVKALGVLLPVLRDQYASQTWVIGLIISLVPGFGAISCPLAGALAKRFSVRYTVMAFNLLSALGLITGSLSFSVSILLVAFLLTGFSIGAEGIVIGELARYFHKNYSVANSIALAGIGVGVIIMPLLTQFLKDIYGWRGAMLILGGIKLHSIISGALLRPVSPPHLEQYLKAPLEDVKNDLKQETSLKKTTSQLDDVEESPQKISSDNSSNQMNATKRLRRFMSGMIFYLDLSLFRDADFISMVLYSIGNGYCMAGWLIYLVPYGLEVDLDPYMASSLATFGGLGQLIGNMVFPLVIRLSPNCRLNLYVSSFVSFVALLANPLASAYYSYIGLICSSAIFGCGRGIAILAFYQDCKQTIDPGQVTNAVMWFHVSYSIGAIFSGFLSGYIFDQTANYASSFIILSSVALISIFPRIYVDMKTKTNCSKSCLDHRKYNGKSYEETKDKK